MNPSLPKSLLLVEDSILIRELYERQFSLSGVRVDTAAGGQEGLEKAKSGTYDVILLDIMMPDITGLEVMKTLKSDESTKNIPVIFLTNMGQDSVIKEGLGLGAIGYLIKSAFTPDQLIKEVALLVSQQNPMRPL